MKLEPNENESIKVSAKTVEEAIALGLVQLGLDRDEVEVEILNEGSRGIFGLGAVDAQVRLTPLRPAPARLPDVAEIGCEVLTKILSAMGIEAEVTVRPQSGRGRQPVVLDITGDDLGILIGRRGETLRALQFITRLIVGRRTRSRANLVLDVEHYKVRRERSLQDLALRMAEKVRQEGKPIALEAMPANERRIVHIALRDHPHVTTESVGEGERRKVTIIPKR